MAIKLDRTAFTKSYTKTKLVHHIERQIGKGEVPWSAQFQEKEGDDAWHPSGDCTPSPYALYWKAKNAVEGVGDRPPSISLYKSFAVGHFWHAYIQHIVAERLEFCNWNAIERKGWKVWKGGTWETGRPNLFGISPEPFHWATGAGDIAPCEIPGQGEYLVDIKTMRGADFAQNGLPNWCAAKYECQINIYMDFFDLERSIILCVQKDSPHDMKEFEFTRNQPLIDAIYDKWKLVSTCIAEDVEPDEDYIPVLPTQGPCVS